MIDSEHLKISNLSVAYNGTPALRNVNFSIPKKKLTAIIGPSGCGKSTLLKCFNRLIDLNDNVRIKGQIFYNNEDIFSSKIDIIKIRKKMGLLLQKPFPLPMSIYDNVAYGPRIHGIKDKTRLNNIVKHFLKEASLWEEVRDKLDEPATNLSVGQQQRLSLARGLAVRPDTILADEPTSSLDPKSSKKIEEKFLYLKNYYTIVLVTHILRQAKRLADYVVFIYLGRVIEYGPVDEVLENPKHKLTIEYVKGSIS